MRLRIALGILAVALMGLPLSARAEDDIVLGHFASITGSTATFGISTDEGIRLLSTLPNLRKVRFEQIMPPEKIELFRRHLPNVELVYGSRVGDKEQVMHENPPSDAEK